MLTNTFCHLRGVGKRTELRLWSQGILSWADYFAWAERPLNPAPACNSRLLRPSGRLLWQLKESEEALLGGRSEYFASLLPSSEYWRLVREFSDQIAFLDVETTGLSRYYDELTMVGLYTRRGYECFVRGLNLECFQEAVRGLGVLVTFNGSQFDIPFLRSAFGGLGLPPIHIDLRFLLARLGLRGGLKRIEQLLGLTRDVASEAITGREAASLWFAYRRGQQSAFEQLVRYNVWDTVNLVELLNFAYLKASHRLLSSNPNEPSVPVVGMEMTASQVEEAVRTTLASLAPERASTYQREQRILPLLKKAGAERSIVGIDLAASPKRPTGWALLKGVHARTSVASTDDEIVELTLRSSPDVVSIDSPLSLPALTDSGIRKIYRQSELELKRRGISVFWCQLPTMVGLTERGIMLANRIRQHGIEVIESFPGAAQDILRIPRKSTGREQLRMSLLDFGIRGSLEMETPTHDELDAITSAIVGYFYLARDYEALGNDIEGYMIVPRGLNPESDQTVQTDRTIAPGGRQWVSQS
jgi:uncharacterized protein YprB with RNaseH-like and TPR domain/predicted nuclease with RNAse H fold